MTALEPQPGEIGPARQRRRWSAGPVEKCDGTHDHRVASVHVIVRCVCGAAYMSTDGGIALGMAQEHDREVHNGGPVPGS